MIETMQQHLLSFWFILGFILLAIEVAAFGMASGVLLFAGIGALITGMLVFAGVLPNTIPATTTAFAITSGLSALLLWKPLKRFQDSTGTHEPMSDLIGYRFRIEQEVSPTQPGEVRYSGVTWRVEIDLKCTEPLLQAGTLVEVVSVDAGLFRVRPVHS